MASFDQAHLEELQSKVNSAEEAAMLQLKAVAAAAAGPGNVHARTRALTEAMESLKEARKELERAEHRLAQYKSEHGRM